MDIKKEYSEIFKYYLVNQLIILNMELLAELKNILFPRDYIEFEVENTNELGISRVFKTQIGYVCSVISVPAIIYDTSALKAYIEDIRDFLIQKYAQNHSWKELNSVLVLSIDNIELWQQIKDNACDFIDKTSFHVNVMRRIVFINTKSFEHTSCMSWNAFDMPTDFLQIEQAIKKWCIYNKK